MGDDGYPFFEASFTRYFARKPSKVQDYLKEIRTAFNEFATDELSASDFIGINEEVFAEKFRSYLNAKL